MICPVEDQHKEDTIRPQKEDKARKYKRRAETTGKNKASIFYVQLVGQGRRKRPQRKAEGRRAKNKNNEKKKQGKRSEKHLTKKMNI